MGLQLQTLAQTVLFALLSVTVLSIRPASDRTQASIAPVLISHSSSESCGAQQFQTWLAGSQQAQPAEEHCTATCDDAPFAENSSECWGSFRFFCKPPAGNHSCGFFGVKCDGHFAYWRLESDGKVVALCEGGLKSMGVKETVCPASGTMWRKFSASGCLGTSSTIMSKKSDSPPSPSDISPIFSRASAAVRLSPGQQAAAARYADAVRQFAEVDAVLASATEPVADGKELSEGDEGMFEGRCDGFSGVGKSVRKVVHGGDDVVTANMLVFDSLDSMQASVHAALGDIDLPEAPPVGDLAEDHADLVADSSNALTALTSGRTTPIDATGLGHGAVECVVRCNGKPAWFAGMWPCWGNATLSCTSTSERASGQVKQAERSHPDVSFSVTCKGVWTGFFGKVCMGLTLEHVHVKSDESWKEVHGICSGKHGVKTRKEKDGFAMGEMCNGKSVVHAHVKHHDEQPDNSKMEPAAIGEGGVGEVRLSM